MSSADHKAVFLSYASQDAEAAKRICDALRQAGVEVWFDQSELVGGDSWDAKIRRQIKECALFVPIITPNTNARAEGYFRLEWKLAVDRSHLMADDAPFLFPIVLGDVNDATARVPDRFRDVQWTRLRLDETPQELAARVARLLSGGPPEVRGQGSEVRGQRSKSMAQPSWLRYAWAAIGLVFGLVYAVRPLFQSGHRAEPKAAITAPAPDPKSQLPTLSEARTLEAQARALIDDDPLAVRENYHTAYELCERAVALSPDDGEIWATMARANCVLIANYNENSDRQVALARSQAERATRLAPHSIESGLAMVSFEGLNRNSAGIPAVRQRLLGLREKAPTDRRILQELVRVEEDEKNPDAGASRRWAEQANALPGGDAKALVNLAWVYWGLNQYPELEATLERALAIQPTSGAYHLKLMVLTVRGSPSGDQAAARAWLQQIPPAILREDRVAMIAGQTLYYSRQPEATLKVLAGIPREILEEGRYFAPRGYLAGEALQMAGKSRAAEVEFRAALKVIEERLAQNARDSRLLVWKGRILARLGDREGAAQQFETARELGIAPSLEVENLMLEGRNDDAIKAADALMVRTRSRWPAMLGSLKANPVYDPLRSDPRFQQIIARGVGWMEAMYAPAAAPPSGESPTPPDLTMVDAKSIAVLPFTNMSEDKAASAFFSDGVQEDILTNLANIREFRVVPRTSVEQYRGTTKNVAQIGQELRVAYVLEGSVRRAGTEVRVTGKLINARTEENVWAKSYDRTLTNIFSIQAELATDIAQALKTALSPEEKTLVERRPTVSPAAYEQFLKAREIRRRFGYVTENAQAMEPFLLEAVRLDPNYAAAHAELVYVYTTGITAATRQAKLAQAQGAVDQALRLAPDSPEVILALGDFYLGSGDAARALEQFERFGRLRPKDPDYLGRLAETYQKQGLSMAQKTWEIRKQLEDIDPGNLANLYRTVNLLVAGRRYADAIAVQRRIWTRLPDNLEARHYISYVTFLLDGSTELHERFWSEIKPDAWDRGVIWRRRWLWMQGQLDQAVSFDLAHPEAGELDAIDLAILDAARGDVAAARARLGDLPEKLRGQTAPGGPSTKNLRLWIQLGTIEAVLGNRPEALRCAQHANELLAATRRPMYELARLHAWAGDHEAALAEIGQWIATDQGGGVRNNVHVLRRNPDFFPLHGDPRFEALLNDPKNNQPLF